jgi:hypothetical protein
LEANATWALTAFWRLLAPKFSLPLYEYQKRLKPPGVLPLINPLKINLLALCLDSNNTFPPLHYRSPHRLGQHSPRARRAAAHRAIRHGPLAAGSF